MPYSNTKCILVHITALQNLFIFSRQSIHIAIFLVLCHFIHSLGINSYRRSDSCQQPLKQHHIFYIHCTVHSLSKALHFQLLLHQLDWRKNPKSFSSAVLHKERLPLIINLSCVKLLPDNCFANLVQN